MRTTERVINSGFPSEDMVQFIKIRHWNFNETCATYWEAGVLPSFFLSTIHRILQADPLTHRIRPQCCSTIHGDACARDTLHPNGCGVVVLSNCGRTSNWITQPHAPTLASWSTCHADVLRGLRFHRLLWMASTRPASTSHFFGYCLVRDGWCVGRSRLWSVGHLREMTKTNLEQ